MITVQTQVAIARTPEEVFAFVADQTNAPLWQAGLIEVRRLTPGPIAVGSEHAFVRQFAGRRVEARNRFVRYEPPHLVEFEIHDGWITGRAGYRVDPHPTGALVTATMDFTAHGPARLAEPLLRRVLERDARKDDARLVAVLESGAEQLEGRTGSTRRS